MYSKISYIDLGESIYYYIHIYMNSTHEKEKKLNEALEKLNLINPQNLNLKETISNLDQQKNQLEIEKKEIEIKYDELQRNYQKLKSKIDDLNNNKENEIKKELEFSDKIDELNQETDSLLEEIDKWET